MAFVNNTRVKFVPTTSMVRPVGGGTTQIELPKTGILMGILLPISVTLSGTLTVPNALGLASCIKRVVVKINAGHTLIDISGAGYAYLLSNFIQDNFNMAIYSDAKSAVTTGTKVLDMFLPIALNTRDEIGLLMLQNMQTFATLTIDWEADATVATGATITGTATPVLMLAEVPTNPADLPAFDTIHQIQEEQAAVAAAGDFDHRIAIGATLAGMYYLLPVGYTRAQLRLQNSNVIADLTPAQHRLLWLLTTSRDVTLSGALSGADKILAWDFAGTDGLGQFGSVRDFVNTLALTDIFSRITAVGASTLYSVRRQILSLNG
jgi:hypothetical protein